MHPPYLLLLLIASSRSAPWKGEPAEVSSASPEDGSEGSGGHWEDDEDAVVPLSAEQRLRDAARFRDELLWDAERDAERTRLAPTPPLRPQREDSGPHREDSGTETAGGADGASELGPDAGTVSGEPQEKRKASLALSGQKTGVDKDDLYFQDGSLLQDDVQHDEVKTDSADGAENHAQIDSAKNEQEREERGNDRQLDPITVQGMPIQYMATHETVGNDSTQQMGDAEGPTQVQSQTNMVAKGGMEEDNMGGEIVGSDDWEMLQNDTEANIIDNTSHQNVDLTKQGVEDKGRVEETNGIGIVDSANAVNAFRTADSADGHSERTEAAADGEIGKLQEAVKSDTYGRHERVTHEERDPVAKENISDPQENPAQTQDKSADIAAVAKENENQLTNGRTDVLGQQEITYDTSSSNSEPTHSGTPSKPSGNMSHEDDKRNTAEMLSSDACRSVVTSEAHEKQKGTQKDDNTGIASPINQSRPEGGPNLKDDSYLQSDACRNHNAEVRSDETSQNEMKAAPENEGNTNTTDVSEATEEHPYMDSDACRNQAADGKSEVTANANREDETKPDKLENTTANKTIKELSYLNSDACRNAVLDDSVAARAKQSVTTEDNNSTSFPIQSGTPRSNPDDTTNNQNDKATVSPLVAPPTPRLPITERTHTSTYAPEVEVSEISKVTTALDQAPASPKHSDSATASRKHGELADLEPPDDEPLHLGNFSVPDELLGDSPDLSDIAYNLTQDSAEGLPSDQTGPVASAALVRRYPFTCKWRCRSLLSELRLQVDPPRLLVAEGAAVSVQCRLPTRLGALTQLAWSFRPAGGGDECALTPAERHSQTHTTRCEGFGDTAQMYFVNQSMTSSRLAIPRVTAALAGHYTCTARVRCCAGTSASTAASSRALSTYLHVYGPGQGTNHLAVSAAAGVCLAAGLAAIVALRRRCCARRKKVPTVRGKYRPMPEGRRSEEDVQEWARLYTGGAGQEEETEMARRGDAQPRQQFRQRHEAEQETALLAPRGHAGDDDGEDDGYEDDEGVGGGATPRRRAGLGAAFAAIPETHIARTHAARPANIPQDRPTTTSNNNNRPAHIRANPLASPHIRNTQPRGAPVISPRYEIPLTPPDAPPTPPDAPHQAAVSLPTMTFKMPLRPGQKKSQSTAGPLWRLGAAARQ